MTAPIVAPPRPAVSVDEARKPSDRCGMEEPEEWPSTGPMDQGGRDRHEGWSGLVRVDRTAARTNTTPARNQPAAAGGADLRLGRGGHRDPQRGVALGAGGTHSQR